jgi:hypothetical protein
LELGTVHLLNDAPHPIFLGNIKQTHSRIFNEIFLRS